MKFCRFIIKPESSWASRLRSDSLYGLILWHVALKEGDARCEELIQAFEAGEPPFILSSPMPYNTVPLPALPPISRSAFKTLSLRLSQEKEPEIALFEALQKFKTFRKSSWLPLSHWITHKGKLSAKALFVNYCQQEKTQASALYSKSFFEPHVSIDRQSGGAKEGQLFFSRLTFYNPEVRFHLYAKVADPKWLHDYLQLIGKTGFGKDASTGKGQFSIQLDNDFSHQDFEVPIANANLLLSVCASPDMSSLAGYYRLEEKRGKTGPGYANPFKRPFLMLQEGSVLNNLPKAPYVLRKLNVNEQIVQILQPLYLPCYLDQEEKE